jgi:hypothetical protein
VRIDPELQDEEGNRIAPDHVDLSAGYLVGIDTSRRIRLSMLGIPLGTSTSSVSWRLYVSWIQTGDVLNSTVTELSPVDVAVIPSGTANQVYKVEFEFELPDALPGDSISFTLWRLGATDLNNDNQGLLTLDMDAYFWTV